MCLYEADRGLLLSGDVLFRGSYGRTDLGGDDARRWWCRYPAFKRDPRRNPCSAGPRSKTTVGQEAACWSGSRSAGAWSSLAEDGRNVAAGRLLDRAIPRLQAHLESVNRGD